MANKRDAEKAAREFAARRYPYEYTEWGFDICFEHDSERRKSWSFGLTPDEEHEDYQPYRTLTGYVHADGTVEGMY